MPERDVRDQLIVALDVSKTEQARKIVKALGDTVTTYKVGSQLFTSVGPEVVRELVAGGLKVFLDLKFHDIPHTVTAAVRSAVSLGMSMLTVHASGGATMLRAAVEAAGSAPKPPLVLAVTVLTSLTDEDLAQTGASGRVLDQVLRLAALARDAGCDGVVASAHEAYELRRELGADFTIAIPGVRPAGTHMADQVRVTTPAEAILAGATHLVVGRPITEAADVAGTARAILNEISTTLHGGPVSR